MRAARKVTATAIVGALAGAGCGSGAAVCPDGTAHGSVIIVDEADLNAITGCTHITGFLTITSPTLTSLAGSRA
jgi:hypothetical protein